MAHLKKGYQQTRRIKWIKLLQKYQSLGKTMRPKKKERKKDDKNDKQASLDSSFPNVNLLLYFF